MRGAELADNAAFGIAPAEAAAMDPCQRLLLERGYEALHGRRTALGCGAWLCVVHPVEDQFVECFRNAFNVMGGSLAL